MVHNGGQRVQSLQLYAIIPAYTAHIFVADKTVTAVPAANALSQFFGSKRCADRFFLNNGAAGTLPAELDDDESGKLRYPNKREIDLCPPNLRSEIEELPHRLFFY
jgi:gamma-glutamyltranspeptidase